MVSSGFQLTVKTAACENRLGAGNDGINNKYLETSGFNRLLIKICIFVLGFEIALRKREKAPSCVQ